MEQYHKIQTVFDRDPATNHKTLLMGQWAKPEFEYLRNNEWLWTEKVDGTNIRVRRFQRDGRQIFEFRGKSNAATLMPSLVERLQDQFPLDAINLIWPGDETICLYGEGFGSKIQNGGGYLANRQGFILFDVRVGDWWLNRPDVEDVAQGLNCPVVPIIGSGSLTDAVAMAQSGYLSRVAESELRAEGLVMRPAVELVNRNGQRVITKVKFKDFGIAPPANFTAKEAEARTE